MTDDLQDIPTAERRYLSCAETAVLVRKALKAEFPKQKFSVRSSTYAGGASIDISWTDGPTMDEVDAVADRFAGADFDGMIDLKTYRDSRLDGERVSFGADFVQTHRRLSDEYRAELEAAVAEQTGRPFDTNGDYSDDPIQWGGDFVPGGRRFGYDLIYRMANVAAREES